MGRTRVAVRVAAHGATWRVRTQRPEANGVAHERYAGCEGPRAAYRRATTPPISWGLRQARSRSAWADRTSPPVARALRLGRAEPGSREQAPVHRVRDRVRNECSVCRGVGPALAVRPRGEVLSRCSGTRPSPHLWQRLSSKPGGSRPQVVGCMRWASRRGRHVDLSQHGGTAQRTVHPDRWARRPHPPRPRDCTRHCRPVGPYGPYVAGILEEEFLARRGQRQSGATRTAPRTQRRSRLSTTRASSPCSPAPCARSRPHAAARPGQACRADQVPGRRLAGARGAGPGQGRHRPPRRPSAPSSSSGSTASRRSWPRPRPGTPRCSPCSPRMPSSPTRPRPSARHAARRRPRAGARGGGPGRAERRPPTPPERRVVPQSVVARQLANPFLAPDFSAGRAAQAHDGPAGQLGAARPAVPGVRVRRRLLLHGPARARRRPARRRASSS